MNAWWASLNGPLHVFYIIAVIGCVLLVAQGVLLLFGVEHFDAHSGEMDADAGGSGHSVGLAFLSVRTVTAFCLGLGWVGVILTKLGLAVPLATLLAALCGVVLAWTILWLMRSMRALASDGTLDYANAVQQIGTVVVSIQAHGLTGGQVQVLVQGRLVVANAIADQSVPAIPPGTKVRVIGLADQTTLRVSPA